MENPDSKKGWDKIYRSTSSYPTIQKKLASLCSDNIILLCSNCHKEIHHGKHFSHSADETKLYIELGAKRVSIQKILLIILRNLNNVRL